MTIGIALFNPYIPGNTGTILRLAACRGLNVHIIEPTGFDLSDRNLKRAGLDYLSLASLQRHINWEAFVNYVEANNKRLILFTTKSTKSYYDFEYSNNDILLFGRESAGVPEYVHQYVNHHLTIPIKENVRSLNLAVSVAMATSVAEHPKKYKG